MTDPSKRSRAENERELKRLYAMYNALPPEKQASNRGHMQARINELVKAIENGGKDGKGGKGLSILQTILLTIGLAGGAVAIGFFAVTWMAQKH